MCGICGLVNLSCQEPVAFGEIKAMADLLWHRGPDDEGYHVENNIGLGHRRLSIIDLDTGRQPIYNETEDICVVFNGEIYNYQELRDWLEARGHRFYTNTDTEVIVHLYEESREDSFILLRGMFAFALWDRNERRMLLVRDRLGIKPLYFTIFGGRLAFASEIKSFLALPGFVPEVDEFALPHYLTWMFSPGKMTLFKGVEKLRPGYFLEVKAGGVRERRYFAFEAAPEDGRPNASYLAELRRHLTESVKLRMIADVPVGAFLSGGIDSSLIVALMVKLADAEVQTFSVGFKEANFSELPYARLVAQALGTDHHEIVVSADEVRDHLERAVYHRDEPLAYPSEVPTLLLAELASQSVKVVLSGEGGDELFAGYPKHLAEQVAGWLRVMPPGLRKSVLNSVASRLPFGARKAQIALRSLAHANDATRWTTWFSAFDLDLKKSILRPWLIGEQANDPVALTASILRESPFHDPLRHHLFLDMNFWLPDNLLQKGDKMTMAASLEARVPLLDQELVEFAFSMPASLKVRGKTGKVALRALAGEVLPAAIRRRKKVGFTLPVGRWFRSEWEEWMMDTVLSRRALQRGYFKLAAVRKLVDEHRKGIVDRQRELWVLVNLEIWHRIFIDRNYNERRRGKSAVRGSPEKLNVRVIERAF